MSGSPESNEGQGSAQPAKHSTGIKKRRGRAPRVLLDQEQVKKIITYNPTTGEIWWAANFRSHKEGDKIVVSVDSLNLKPNLYFYGNKYKLTKLLWLWFYGVWPDEEVLIKEIAEPLMAIANLTLRTKNERPLTYERAHELFSYNSETGVLTRKCDVLASNGRVNCREGDIAGYKAGESGYLIVCIDHISYSVHRVIWLMEYGYLPEAWIDHKNHIRSDNRKSNLREVSPICNSRNSLKPKNNTTGVVGVASCKVDSNGVPTKWTVYIKVNYKNIYLGYYTDFTEAVAHRLAAEQFLGWEGCDSNSTAYQYMQRYLQGLRDAK